MVIREMNKEECLQVLAASRLARLACARENQPYVVPAYLSYCEATGCLYGFTTRGQKVEWMRANPLVCVEVEEITSYDQWVTVIVTGRYEELEATPESSTAILRTPERPRHAAEVASSRSSENLHPKSTNERERAWQVLQTHPEWWEPGSTAWAARIHRDADEPYVPIYYRILIDQITGHQATQDPRETIATDIPTERTCWICSAISRAFGGISSQKR